MEKLFDCLQIAERYGVEVTTVQAWIREGKLGALRIGKSYRIRESDLSKFEREQETKSEK